MGQMGWSIIHHPPSVPFLPPLRSSRLCGLSRLLTVSFLLSAFCSLLFLASACKKSSPETNQTSGSTNHASSSLAPRPSPLLRLHWLGKKRLAAETNAAHFMEIWKLPESAALEKQFLDKWAVALTAPNWDWSAPGYTNHESLVTNPLPSLLRPLLDDLIQQECYLEVRNAERGKQNGSPLPSDGRGIKGEGGTNDQLPITNYQLPMAPEAVLAVSLPPDRARLWESNLARLGKKLGPCALSFSRDGDWELVTINPAPLPSDGRGIKGEGSGEWRGIKGEGADRKSTRL